jgi:sulfatase maturation enzyme AslB (radical SAM superfamily)
LRKEDDDLSIKVVTNGSMITDEIIEKIVSYEIAIKISIYGFSDDIAKKVTNKEQPGYIHKITKIIEKLYKNNVPVTVNILMNSFVEKEIEQILEAIEGVNETDGNKIGIKIIEMVQPVNLQGISLFKPIDHKSRYGQWKYECCSDEK